MLGVMRGKHVVTGEHELLRRLVETQVTGRVARRPNCGEVPTRHLRSRPVFEEDVGDHGVDQLPHRHRRVLQRLQLLGWRAHTSERRRHPVQQVVGLVVAVVNELGVGGVQRDPGARGLPDAPGQSVVVGVDVRHHDALDVGDVAPHLLHAGRKRPEGVIGVPAGVDQIRPLVRLEDVDEDVTQRVVRERHRNAPEPVPDLLDAGERVVGRGGAAGALGVGWSGLRVRVRVLVTRCLGHDWDCPRGSRGRPSPRSAMRFRMISFDPPAMVQARA